MEHRVISAAKGRTHIWDLLMLCLLCSTVLTFIFLFFSLMLVLRVRRHNRK